MICNNKKRNIAVFFQLAVGGYSANASDDSSGVDGVHPQTAYCLLFAAYCPTDAVGHFARKGCGVNHRSLYSREKKIKKRCQSQKNVEIKGILIYYISVIFNIGGETDGVVKAENSGRG